MCKPYLTGVNLYKLNARNNKRRIILKFVPSYLRVKEVRNALEDQFGEIEEIYPFLSDSKYHDESRRKYYTYSVMFVNPSAAQKVANLNVIQLKVGVHAQVEKYAKKKGRTHKDSDEDHKHKNKPLQPEKVNNKIWPASISPKCSEGQINSSHIPIRKENGSRSKSEKRLSKGNLIHTTSKVRRTSSLERLYLVPKGFQRMKLIEMLRTTCSFLKPTSNLYYLLRSEDFEYIATFELKNAWISNTNFRRNLQIPKETRVFISEQE
jgi:hypothetical protein